MIKNTKEIEMGYVEESLTPGEEIVIKARLHWGMFVGPAIYLVLGFLLLLLGFSDDDLAGMGVCGGILFFFAIIAFLNRVLNYFTTEFAVTNKRLIGKTGILRRRSIETMLMKVEGIKVDQPLSGRIFGYGTLMVTGSGGSKQPFPYVANAMEIRKQVVSRLPSL
jgi:uncharacterized membrane protein YdbT with pleckstrin-like domain